MADNTTGARLGGLIGEFLADPERTVQEKTIAVLQTHAAGFLTDPEARRLLVGEGPGVAE